MRGAEDRVRENACGVRDRMWSQRFCVTKIQADLKNKLEFWNRVATLQRGKMQLSFSDERGFAIGANMLISNATASNN